MGELSGRTILIVVANEINQFVWDLQEEVERTGAKTTVAFGPPDTTDAAAAIVSVEQQAVLSSMRIPIVVYYEGDTPEQILARLRRVLRLPAAGAEPAARAETVHEAVQEPAAPEGRWGTRRGMATLLVLLFLASLAGAAGLRLVLTYFLGWD